MKLLSALVFVSVVLPAWGQRPRHDVASMFQSCAACHGMPDSRVSSDNLWIDRIATTACVAPAAPKSDKKRVSLMQFLKSKKTSRPQLERSPRVALKTEGQITAPFDQGVVLLMPLGDSKRKPIRLTWDEKSPGSTPRSLLAGTYQIRNYKIRRLDKKGQEWELWASGRGQKIEVVALKVTKLSIDTGVQLKTSLRARRNRVQAGVAVLGDHGMGATLIRNGRRVAARCKLISQEKTQSNKNMSYG